MAEEVYVHHNPGSIKFNAGLYVFIRSWYMPTETGETPAEDTWLRVPAFKSPGPGGKDHYALVNPNIELISMVVVTDDGIVRKVSRARPFLALAPSILKRITDEAIDVPEWEMQNQKSWPYATMFNKDLVKERYAIKYGETKAPYFNVTSTNQTYMHVKRAVLPKPCSNCGQGRKRVRG